MQVYLGLARLINSLDKARFRSAPLQDTHSSYKQLYDYYGIALPICVSKPSFLYLTTVGIM